VEDILKLCELKKEKIKAKALSSIRNLLFQEFNDASIESLEELIILPTKEYNKLDPEY
jgi:hypothetical protein